MQNLKAPSFFTSLTIVSIVCVGCSTGSLVSLVHLSGSWAFSGCTFGETSTVVLDTLKAFDWIWHKDNCSSTGAFNSGISQGSVPSPILYLLFIKSLLRCIVPLYNHMPIFLLCITPSGVTVIPPLGFFAHSKTIPSSLIVQRKPCGYQYSTPITVLSSLCSLWTSKWI